MSVASDRRISSRYMVDFAVAGHFLLRERINAAVLRISDRFGKVGRERMYQLPPMNEYPSEDEVSSWQQLLLEVEQTLMREAEQQRQAVEDRYQLKFPWS